MAEIVAKNKLLDLSNGWPHDRIYALIQRASGLFIWASTACKFIDAYDPEQQLSILLQTKDMSNAESALDRLYITALESAGEWTDTSFSTDFRAIMGAVLVAKNPLTVAALNELLTFNQPLIHAISKLGCVLYANPIIHILHPSFADFLSNRARCKYDMWFIDLASHNFCFTVHCLDHLDGFLRYNMCSLKLSQTVHVEGASLPEGVSYACIFWVEHVCIIKDATSIAEKLETFLFKHLLHWFEAMAILKRSRDTIGILRHLHDWHMTVWPNNFHLQDLINDACRFAQNFIRIIEHHPLQVYASALPFTPINTTLYHHFHKISQNPQIVMGADTSWSNLLLTFSNIEMCHHLSFSHDGKQVLSGTMNGTFYIHDTTTGVEICTLQGHNKLIPSVSFCPNGSHIVSGSHDQTIRVWDIMTGKEIYALTDGHTDSVNSVAYCPKGQKIVSASKDCTILVWNPISQTIILHLQGNHQFNYAAFSPDGT
ncbi:hypothetical protein PILCRDRAFT_64660 [Piloderma croceum F 1598]|uniref:Uncharacterized protein n=1 Tax=Piloderma croceum (strain F 1598) TaxID=765440 RepID=A0A0C3G7N7_PILCF|nr:hypothetical protein PILCRDRAFT_64660 [Piloderma croceum F 1598]